MAVSCSGSSESAREHAGMKKAPVIEGVTFVYIPASTFPFNAVPTTLRTITGSEHQFQVIQSGFWISDEPVTPSLYESIMGEGTWPNSGVSYDDAQAFLNKLYHNTHYPVVLLTECMYEAALRSDLYSPESYWNELVSDRWANNAPDVVPVKNWKVSEGIKDLIVTRKAFERAPFQKFRRRQSNVFHICIKEAGASLKEFEVMNDITDIPRPEMSDGKDEEFTVDGVSFKMVAVAGGNMQLGGTEEQKQYPEPDELPVRDVHITSFKIGETEVTRALWDAVMGGLPGGNTLIDPEVPVCGINWYDAQLFAYKLSQITGRPFRIPSEDEWEAACRGSIHSRHFMFSGSNTSAEVAVCKQKDGVDRKLEPVKTLQPNELGLYDMSGNLWEWVRGEAPDGRAMLKGGCYRSKNTACRVSNRQPMQPEIRKATFGLRLAL